MRATLIAILLCCVGNLFAQQDTTQTTFHVKVAFTRANSVYFESAEAEQVNGTIINNVSVFIGKNGDAYIYWKVCRSNDGTEVGCHWDSVNISADTANVNAMSRIITPRFIKSVNECADDFTVGYSIGIEEGGKSKAYTGIPKSSIKKNHCEVEKLTTLIRILNEEYKKNKR